VKKAEATNYRRKRSYKIHSLPKHFLVLIHTHLATKRKHRSTADLAKMRKDIQYTKPYLENVGKQTQLGNLLISPKLWSPCPTLREEKGCEEGGGTHCVLVTKRVEGDGE
jgi:hypothetical protein